jgi:hypothetical protein
MRQEPKTPDHLQGAANDAAQDVRVPEPALALVVPERIVGQLDKLRQRVLVEDERELLRAWLVRGRVCYLRGDVEEGFEGDLPHGYEWALPWVRRSLHAPGLRLRL